MDAAESAPAGLRLVEARRLTGPNVYFRTPAVRLELAGAATPEQAARAAARVIERLSRLGEQSGWPPAEFPLAELRLDLRLEGAVIAFPARWTFAGQLLGEEAALGALAELAGESWDWEAAQAAIAAERLRELPPPRALAVLDEAARRGLPAWWPFGPESGLLQIGYGARGVRLHVSEIEAGAEVPWEQSGRIPIVAISGTNGKTTTTRLLARIARDAGLAVGNTSSDGVVIGDQWVLGGDFTGQAGAARVLSDPYVEVAVLETARGGLLRSGAGFDRCDVVVLTNVTPDHLGQFGVETVAQMAAVKGTLLELLARGGTAVLNAADPQLVAQAPRSRAPVTFFAREPALAALAAQRAAGGRAVFARDGMLFLAAGAQEEAVIAVADIPIAYGGAAGHNVENALGVIGAAAALGWPLAAIRSGLHGFWPTLEENPGRLNSVEVRGVRVVLDFAHNPDGVRALMAFGRNLQPRRLIAVLGAHGDRSDALLRAEAREVARSAAGVVIKEDARALRGRRPGEVPGILAAELREAGLGPDDIRIVDDERAAVEAALAVAQAGDVVLVMCHEDRHGIMAWLRGLG
jgi:cyanophycin synthetase